MSKESENTSHKKITRKMDLDGRDGFSYYLDLRKDFIERQMGRGKVMIWTSIHYKKGNMVFDSSRVNKC